jgi:hypothetical protein
MLSHNIPYELVYLLYPKANFASTPSNGDGSKFISFLFGVPRLLRPFGRPGRPVFALSVSAAGTFDSLIPVLSPVYLFCFNS